MQRILLSSPQRCHSTCKLFLDATAKQVIFNKVSEARKAEPIAVYTLITSHNSRFPFEDRSIRGQ